MDEDSRSFDELNAGMLPRLLSINPDCATIFGKHDPYDWQLPHGGYQKLKDNLDLLTEWSKEANEIAARELLSRDQNVSLSVLEYTLETYRFAIEDHPLWKMRPEGIENPGSAMLMMVVRDYAPLPRRLDAIATRLGELPRYLEQFRGRYRGARTVKTWTEAAIETCRAFPVFLDTAQSLAIASADAKVRSNMTKGISCAREELQVHEDWLMKMLDSSTDGFAMGREKFERLLRIRRIPYDSRGLLDLARTNLEEFRRQRESVAQRISKEGSLEEARRIVEADCPGSAIEVVERTKIAVEKAKRFVIERDLATVLEGPRVLVMKTPEFLGKGAQIASTFLPAVFEETQDTVFLASGEQDPNDMSHLYDYARIDGLAVHEAYPGHHHQGSMSNRKPWMHQLPHIIYSPETLSPPYESQEGWATYCEDLMGEQGFMGSDRHLLGTLDYRILMACRAISEVKLSCEEATLEEMTEMTAREAGMPRSPAESDVKAFTRVPGYGICYLLGRHLVVGLLNDLRERLGPGFSEKRFHDLVAENGNLPFYLLEKEVRHRMGVASDAM
jgi:hypothetical protein